MNKQRRAIINRIINTLYELRSDVETVQDEEQTAFDNLPESMQESAKGEAMQDNADSLSDALDMIDEAIESLESAME